MNLKDLLYKEYRDYYEILAKKDLDILYQEISFLEPFFKCRSLSRLSGVSYFCEVDYNKIKTHKTKTRYSRLNHSLACAIMIWTHTNNKCETILALLHDINTPVFSHAVDYVFKDFINQESSKRDIKKVIESDKELKLLLKNENINYSNLNLAHHFLIDCDRPKLCVDRLDSIFASNLFWSGEKNLDQLKYLYQDVTILLNEQNHLEFGFKNLISASVCYDWNELFSKKAETKEDKLALSLLGDIILYGIKERIYTMDDIYEKEEQEIIEMVKKSNCKKLKEYLNYFANLSYVYTSSSKQDEYYNVKITTKKRNIDPLFSGLFGTNRLLEVSENYLLRNLIYNNEEENHYSYVKIAPLSK